MNRVRGNKRADRRFDIVAVVSERRRLDEGNSSSSSPSPSTAAPSSPRNAAPATCAIGPCHCCPCLRCSTSSSFRAATHRQPARERRNNCFRLGAGCAAGRSNCGGSRRRIARRVCCPCRQSLSTGPDYANGNAHTSFADGPTSSGSCASKSEASSNTSGPRPGCDGAPERTQRAHSSAEECFDCGEQSCEHIISEHSPVQESVDERRRRCRELETRGRCSRRRQQRAAHTSRPDQNRSNKSTEACRDPEAKHKHPPSRPTTSASKAAGSQATGRPSESKLSGLVQQAAEGAEDCALDNGDNSRCNCAGRRRPSLARLIELFEQQARVDSAWPDAIGRPSSAKAGEIGPGGEMRDILTPVKYAATPSHSSSSDEENFDDHSIESHSGAMSQAKRVECQCQACRHDKCLDSVDSRNCRAAEQKQVRARANKSPIERIISTGGVQVLPSWASGDKSRNSRDEEAYLRKKLTKTHWQPPTDGRKYELAGYERHAAARRYGSKVGAPAPSLAGHCCPSLVRHQPSSSRRQLKQLARLKRVEEPARLYKVNRQGRRQRAASAARVEELIEQLERATVEMEEDEHLLDRAERRDLHTKYQERSNAAAARKSQPPEQQEQQSNDDAGAREQKQESTVSGGRSQLIDFGRRADMDPLEEESIARSHCAMRQAASGEWAERRAARRDWPGSAIADRYRDDLAVRRLSGPATRCSSVVSGRVSSPTAMDPRVSYLLCSDAYAPKIEGRTAASAHTDSLERRLRLDDLHYRAVRPSPVPREPPFGVPRNQQAPPKSALASRATGARPTATERLRSNSKTSFLEFENCAGEQRRREASADSMQRAEGEQQQQQQAQYKATSPTRTSLYNQVYKSPSRQSARRANESRVSFSPINPQRDEQKVAKLTPSPDGAFGSRASGCASADSGIAATSTCAESPVIQGGPQTGDSQLGIKLRCRRGARNLEREIQTLDGFDGDDLDEDVVLAELDKAVQQDQQTSEACSACETPTIERVHAEMRAAPTVRRPRITIAEPRSKSPLLRVARSQEATKEPVDQVERKPERECVVIQRYEDSWPRRRKSSEREKCRSTQLEQAMSSLEFQCDFNDDEDSDQDPDQSDSYKTFMRQRYQSPVVAYESSQASSTPNETSGSSLDRLEAVDRDKTVGSRESDSNKQSEPQLKSATDTRAPVEPAKFADKSERRIMFSIGQYDSSLNKRHLKIL